MLSKDNRREKSFLPKENLGQTWTLSGSGTRSPATIITSSSGYSTGSSSVSTTVRKFSTHQREQHVALQTKTKAKGKEQ